MYVAGTMLVTCERFGLFGWTDDTPPTSGTDSDGSGHTPLEGAAPRYCSSAFSGILIDNYKTTLPTKKGLSSSAAVCVLVVRALCLVFHLQLSVSEVCQPCHIYTRKILQHPTSHRCQVPTPSKYPLPPPYLPSPKLLLDHNFFLRKDNDFSCCSRKTNKQKRTAAAAASPPLLSEDVLLYSFISFA